MTMNIDIDRKSIKDYFMSNIGTLPEKFVKVPDYNRYIKTRKSELVFNLNRIFMTIDKPSEIDKYRLAGIRNSLFADIKWGISSRHILSPQEYTDYINFIELVNDIHGKYKDLDSHEYTSNFVKDCLPIFKADYESAVKESLIQVMCHNLKRHGQLLMFKNHAVFEIEPIDNEIEISNKIITELANILFSIFEIRYGLFRVKNEESIIKMNDGSRKTYVLFTEVVKYADNTVEIKIGVIAPEEQVKYSYWFNDLEK